MKRYHCSYKKWFRSLCILGLLMGLNVTSAQALGLSLGIRGGINYSVIEDSDPIRGFTVGPTLSLQLPLGFHIESGALFSQKGFRTVAEGTVSAQDYRISYLHVPVVAQGHLSFGLFDFSVGMGGYKAFALEDYSEDVTIDNENGFKDEDYGLLFNLGIQLFKKLQIDGFYEYGLSNLNCATNEKSRNRTLTVAASWLF